MRSAATPMVYMPLPSLMILAVSLLIAAGLLSGCAGAGQPPLKQIPATKAKEPLQTAQTADYFLMEPTRLEKGHIFMRRSAKAEPEEVDKTEAVKAEPAEVEKDKDEKTVAATTTPEEPEKTADASAQTAQNDQNTPDTETLRNQALLLMGETGGNNQMAALPPHKWQDIRKVKVQVHVQNKPFQTMLEDVLDRVEPRTGPWRLQWKITRENRDLLDERFSLNTETTFDRFVSSVAAFIQNYRGVELNFELFEKERVLVISDVFPN